MSEKSLVPIQDRIEQLYREIRQIYEQYKKEVPKKRRPWPESIKSRILELWKLGVSSHQIAQDTGLPTQTMYSWRQRIMKTEPGFVPVPIIRKRRHGSKVQLSQLDTMERRSPTVTVVVGDIRIEGLSEDKVASLVREILRA